jgi:hypothetical protein
MKSTDPSIAGDENPVSDSISFEELIAQRTARASARNAESEATTEEPETSDEEVQDDDEEGYASQEDDARDDEEGSEEVREDEQDGLQVDLLNLSPEQIQELAKSAKSRLLDDLGKTRKENRQIKEELAQLREQVQGTNQKAVKEIPDSDNPFRDLSSADEIKAKYDEMERTLETTDALLEEYEDYGPDDLITVGSQEFSKRDIRKANRNAREAITKYLPSRHQQLAKVAQYEVMAQQYSEAARKEVPEIEDTESEVGKNYSSLLQDPLVGRLRKEIPELGMQIEYILAHAARSIFGRKSKSIPTGAGTKMKVEPPSSPVGSGAARSGKNPKGKVQDAFNRFEKSGAVEDWVAARIAKLR